MIVIEEKRALKWLRMHRTVGVHISGVVLGLVLLVSFALRVDAQNQETLPGSEIPLLDCAPTVDRVMGPVGGMVLVPLGARGGSTPPASGWRPASVRVTDENGTVLEARVIGLTFSSEIMGWVVQDVDESPQLRGLVVSWCLVLDVGERAGSRRLRVGGRQLEIIGLDPVDLSGVSRMLSAPGASVEQIRRLGERLRSLYGNPRERWRAMLVEERFGATALWGDGPRPSDDPEPILRAWGVQEAIRVHHAISQISAVDPELGADVLGTLTSVVRFPGGELVPVWSGDRLALEELIDGVLGVRDAQRVIEEARAFLDREPAIWGWMVDEGGSGSRLAGGGLVEVTVGIAEMRGRRTVVSSGPVGARAASVNTLEGHTSIEQRVLVAIGDAQQTGVIRIRGADEIQDLDFVGRALVVQPPGLTITTLREEWRQGWFGSERVPGRALEWETSGLLYAGTDQSEVPARTWWLYLECLDPQAESIQGDVIRVWLGRHGEAERIIRIARDGGSDDAITGDDVEGVVVNEHERGWSVHVPLGRAEDFSEEILLLGVERFEGDGRRWSWPRPMTPGQREPGRLAIDLRSWTALPETVR